MTGLVLPMHREHADRVVRLVAAEGLCTSTGLECLRQLGLTADENALDAAVYHLLIVQHLRAGDRDARTVVDALPTVPYPEVLAGAIAEHEQHYRDAVDVLAVRQAGAS